MGSINARRTGQQRDSQRSRVYAADRSIQLPYKNGRAPDPALADIAACQAYVDRILASAWYRQTYPRGPIRVHVRHGGGASAARAGGNRMMLPAWARQPGVILHELAHCIIDYVRPPGVAWHGWEFCSVYLALVERWMGRKAGATLRAAFKTHRVRYRAPRTLSPEHRAAAVARLLAHREQRQAAQAAAVAMAASAPGCPAAAPEPPGRRVALDLARARAWGA